MTEILLRFTTQSGRPFCFGAVFSARGNLVAAAPKYHSAVRCKTIEELREWYRANRGWFTVEKVET